MIAWSYEIVDELLCHWIFNCTVSHFLISFLFSYFSYETILFLTKSFSFFFLISYISKMKIKSSNARIQTHDLRIWQIWVCEILIDWIYWIQKDSFIFDLWRNLFRTRDDETKIKSEIEYVSLRKTRCPWTLRRVFFLAEFAESMKHDV